MASGTGRRKAFADLVRDLNMENFVLSKLTLRDVLSIKPQALKACKPQKIDEIGWCFLRKIMSLNTTARNTLVDGPHSPLETTVDDLFQMLSMSETVKTPSIHPLDVICVLLHCADRFLQQEIITKMSTCQFSVPLLLPPMDGPSGTLMLWALRDIVKKWRPETLADSKGFREDNVVDIEMPIFSFVRLGKSKLSKSKTLNHILNPEQQYHSFFIHDNVEGGNLERKISDGLVEISWYFPSGKSDVFPEPIAVTNLRGDLESYWDEFLFLARISSAVFIFIESMCEREFQLLSTCSNQETKFSFIVTPGPSINVSRETATFLKDLLPLLKCDNSSVVVKNKDENEASMTKKIERKIEEILQNPHRSFKLSDVLKGFSGLSFVTDENSAECQKASEKASNIINEIRDITDYKKRTMKLQRDLWKELSKLEKECCRMKKQGDKDAQKYLSELLIRRNSLRREQYQQQMPRGIKLFTEAMTNRSQEERHYFLKWMKLKLDSIARNNLSTLQAKYREKIITQSYSSKELKELDQTISDSSLGIEHFLRELGQFYEAECSVVKQNFIPHRKKFSDLPGIAANLLLDGYPLELIDGDASNIPLQWITDVLTELDKNTGGQCRMRVITVLGVQSTGKSTLLNTMFGLQFPVASGRCTRGAFMTLIKLEESFQKELGCHFILVVDTEGLKAPELASLDDSYEHDNELATLVVGLSDITIVNMAMENTAEMKDILQIVVHAFLRMKEVGKKPSCQFVHQNVSDVSAYEKNMRDRKKLLEQLNDMTKIAANMEKKSGIKTFSDVMDYDLEKHNWYIPGLWQGDPPMAPVNLGYSANVFELKKYLIEFLKTQKSHQKPSNIPDFIAWIESLWRAVKHEKFIYSFRNSLVAKAYNKLVIEYSNWEWDFLKRIHNWCISTDNLIQNLSTEMTDRNKNELQNILLEEENKMIARLEKYFDNSEDVNLIERYREEFKRDIKELRKELGIRALNKYSETVSIQKGKLEIQNIQNRSQQLIEEKISNLLDFCRQKNRELDDQEIKQEFEVMWKKTLSDLHFEPLKRRDVGQAILKQLKNDMSRKGPHINETLIKVKHLQIHQERFIIDKSYIDLSWTSISRNYLFVSQEVYDTIGNLAASLINMCKEYINDKKTTSEDYADVYCKELLHMINAKSQSKSVKKLHYTSLFELNIKLYIFGQASREFQQLHDRFIQENDPRLCLEKLKPQYFSTFLGIFQKKDECRSRAKRFCDLCLRPALTDYIFKHLGKKIVDDVLNNSDNVSFSSRSFFQCTVLEKLLKENSFKQYVEYINSYETFSKMWILSYISSKYRNPLRLQTLEKNLLSYIDAEIKHVLNNDRTLKSNTVPGLLTQFCEMLKEELVIPKKEMNVITFHNKAKVEEFSEEIQHFLVDTETQILSELRSMTIESVLSKLTLKPQDELFRKVIGCGHQCPFCKVPCEAGGGDHKEHFASIHRPEGLGQYRWLECGDLTDMLVTDICTTSVVSGKNFKNSDTDGQWHPYKEYRTYYPDWAIQPDPSIESSDYWKYVFVQFNEKFAEEYKAKPADLPDDWRQITREQALSGLKKTFNIN